MRPPLLLGFSLASAALSGAPISGVRNLYLNGVDISSAKGQELKNVDVSINERGDIFIIAPHYQVHEEDSYVPLSKYVKTARPPRTCPRKAGPRLSGRNGAGRRTQNRHRV